MSNISEPESLRLNPFGGGPPSEHERRAAQRLADPGPTARMMSANPHEELYKLLLDTAEESPLEVLANCVEIMATVMNRRLHDYTDPG